MVTDDQWLAIALWPLELWAGGEGHSTQIPIHGGIDHDKPVFPLLLQLLLSSPSQPPSSPDPIGSHGDGETWDQDREQPT